MTFEEAKHLLLRHCFAAEDPRMASGFLGSLRPYTGRLNPENFHEVMAALEALAPQFEAAAVDREILKALWGMTHFARIWAVDPGGMLRQNKLISDEDVATLSGWVETISFATFMLLEGAGVDEAFQEYRRMVRPSEHERVAD